MIDSSSHSFYKLYFHFVCSTKNKLPLIIEEIEGYLKNYLFKKCKELDIRVFRIGGTTNHIHIVFSLRPSHCIREVIKNLKGSSSHAINEKFYRDNNEKFEWQKGYGIISISERDLPIINKYIENQKRHHKEGKLNKSLEKY